MEKLTVQQAIDNGYVYWHYDDSEYESLRRIDEIKDADFSLGKVMLSEKEARTPAIPTSKDLMDDIIKNICVQHCDETGDDTSAVDNALSKIDHSILQPVVDSMTQAVSKIKYYMCANIELIPNHPDAPTA